MKKMNDGYETLYPYDNIMEDPEIHSENLGGETLLKYLEEHKDDIYNITIEGREYNIKVKFLIGYITADDKYFSVNSESCKPFNAISNSNSF